MRSVQAVMIVVFGSLLTFAVAAEPAKPIAKPSAALGEHLEYPHVPPDGVNVRITWLNANARHPQWVPGPGAGK